MRTNEPALTPLEVIAYYGELTGIRYRENLIPQPIQQQASIFAMNFELWQLRLVYEWTRQMVREGERRSNGFSRLSFQWHNMIASGGDTTLEAFQRRLGLATEWAWKYRKSLLVSADVHATAEAVPTPAPVAALVHGEAPETSRIREESVRGFEALKQSLLGLGADEVEKLKSAAPVDRPALPAHE